MLMPISQMRRLRGRGDVAFDPRDLAESLLSASASYILGDTGPLAGLWGDLGVSEVSAESRHLERLVSAPWKHGLLVTISQ